MIKGGLFPPFLLLKFSFGDIIFIKYPGKYNMDKNLKYAFVRTLPILVGFIFIGAALGLLANEMGFGLLQTVFMSAVIYAGSIQFALLPIIGGAGSFATIILISLSVSSRQMFYGLSFIERFRKMGRCALL